MDATTIFNKSEASIKVMKMSKGYNWEIKAYGANMDEILKTIVDTEAKVKAQFATE